MIIYLLLFGGIGEVVNTPDCGSGMQGFDPLIPPQIVNRDCRKIKYLILHQSFFKIKILVKFSF